MYTYLYLYIVRAWAEIPEPMICIYMYIHICTYINVYTFIFIFILQALAEIPEPVIDQDYEDDVENGPTMMGEVSLMVSCDMAHTWMSHGTHMDESWHTHTRIVT